MSEASAREVLGIAIPADRDIWMIGNLHYGCDDGQWRSFTTMNFQPNLLSVVGAIGAHDIERAADLLDCFFVRDAFRQIIGPDFDAAAAHEGDLRPGNSPALVNYDNNVEFGASSSLNIELGGRTVGSQYDRVHVTGAVVLGGTLKVSLINLGTGLFTPQVGDVFDILDWGTLSGAFDSLQLPTLPDALAWNTSQLYTSGVLGVVSAGLPGDYNNNGVVDAADYVTWRNGLGTIYTQSDYGVWRSHFGQTAGSGAEVRIAVPEPSISLQAILAVAGLFSRRRRRRRIAA